MNVIKQYSKNKLPCEYLYSSTNNLLNALRYYNSPIPGDVEKSFSSFWKAWDHLWQAHRIYNSNGDFFNRKEKDKIFGLSDLINRVSDDSDLNGYSHSESYSIFRMLDSKSTPFFVHLELFKQIRNFDQHDYLEQGETGRISLTSLTNPYVISTLLNYFEQYEDTFSRIRETCVTHHKSKSHCQKSLLAKPEELINEISFPIPLIFIINPIAHKTLLSRTKKAEIESSKKGYSLTLKAEVISAIKIAENKIPKNSTKTERRIFVYEDFGITVSEARQEIRNYIESFSYKDSEEFLKFLNKKMNNKVDINDVLNILEDIYIKENTDEENNLIYRRVFFQTSKIQPYSS